MFRSALIIFLFANTILYASTPYMEQIKIWDACTYTMETVRIDLMQLKNNSFEEIDPQKAIALCRQSLTRYPDDPHVKFLLARAYTKDKQYKKGFELATQSCKAGDIGGCTLLGGYYDFGLLPQKRDLPKSILLWLWSCTKGDSQACTNLYNKAADNSIFVPKEIKHTDLMLLDLCSKGDYPPACYEYAKNCSRDRLYSEECKYASSRSCISGNETGCLFYDEIIKKEPSTHQTYKEKYNIYTKSCNNGNAKACRYLAHKYASKKRTKVNNIMALSLYKDACLKGNDATACRYAGAYYLANLEGITADIPLGISLLEKSCKPARVYKEAPGHASSKVHYDIKGCLDLAKYYLYAPQEKYRDKEKAKQTLEQACSMIEYYYTSKLGCKLGVEKCCSQLKKKDRK